MCTGADVRVHGKNWNEADILAREMAQDPEIFYVPPYDHPLLWSGHSTVIDELASELPEPASHIICSVGGGGLLAGVFEGLKRHDVSGWGSAVVVACETYGTASFAGAWGEGKPDPSFKLASIDSIASTLGALQVLNNNVQF